MKATDTTIIEAGINELFPMHKKIEAWIESASDSIYQHSIKCWEDTPSNHAKLKFTRGKKYYRVYTYCPTPHRERGAYCCIDFEGNIYKATSVGVAPKVRSHINEKDPDTVTCSTSWLYRN